MLGIGQGFPLIPGAGTDCRTGYAFVHGVLVEPLGENWVAFSPASGETHLVNDTMAAIVELVAGEVAVTCSQLAEVLAADAGVAPPDTESLVQQALQMLIAAGLLREVPLSHATPQ